MSIIKKVINEKEQKTMIYFLLIVILTYVIYQILIKKEKKKQQTEFDAFIVESAIKIVSDIRDFKKPYVQSLQKGEEFYLVFEKGFVYYETSQKNRECLLTPIRNLNDNENKNFAELVYGSLSRENGISASITGEQITVSKV